jgi:hypothetical protein
MITASANGVFRALAGSYREHGMYPRPITLNTKACHLLGWQKPDSEIPSDQLAGWLSRHGDCGIGLLMGSPFPDGTTLGALDIDREEYVKLGNAVLRQPPCGRIGKKGVVFFVRVRDDLGNPEFRVKGRGKVAECLFRSKLCVIPPTIHPETGQAYRWIGPSLLDIDFKDLPLIERSPGATTIELIKAAFTSEHYPVLFEGAATHDPGLRFIAQLVSHTQDVDLISEIVASALPPDYSGDLLAEIPRMVQGALARGFSKSHRPTTQSARESQSEKLLAAFKLSGATLFHDQTKRGFISVKLESER